MKNGRRKVRCVLFWMQKLPEFLKPQTIDGSKGNFRIFFKIKPEKKHTPTRNEFWCLFVKKNSKKKTKNKKTIFFSTLASTISQIHYRSLGQSIYFCTCFCFLRAVEALKSIVWHYTMLRVHSLTGVKHNHTPNKIYDIHILAFAHTQRETCTDWPVCVFCATRIPQTLIGELASSHVHSPIGQPPRARARELLPDDHQKAR